MGPTETIKDSVLEVLRTRITEMDGVVYVVDPTETVFEQLIDVVEELDDTPSIRVVAEERVLKAVLNDFIVASNTADLVDAGTLSLRTSDRPVENALLVHEDSVTALVSAGTAAAGLATDDEEFVETVNAVCERRWEDADDYNLRTPPISKIRETMGERIGEDARDDFEAVLSSLETARGNGTGLDEVTISLLVAARNEVLLYDISKWGEDIGIASKATFSRTKTELENAGLIDTEKVPIDVGRPRLRLKLGDDRLNTVDPVELANTAQSVLG